MIFLPPLEGFPDKDLVFLCVCVSLGTCLNFCFHKY